MKSWDIRVRYTLPGDKSMRRVLFQIEADDQVAALKQAMVYFEARRGGQGAVIQQIIIEPEVEE